jgi:D-alanine-D-alanine ligase
VRIAVLLGGTSAERDISLVTGRAVGLALADRGHDVLLVDPGVGDRPVGPREAEAAARIGSTPPSILNESGSALAAVAGEAVQRADVVFVALHGGTGEDGTIQGLLELANKPYTGSGVLASALAMDKRVSKLLFREAGVATPAWRVVSSEPDTAPERRGGAPSLPTDVPPSRAVELVDGLGGCPVVVKPNDQGSTVGLTVVHDPNDLPAAVELAASFSPHVLVEEYIPGREVTVAVLGGEPLPVVEIAPKGGLYDYESKYTKGMSSYTCPAEIPDTLVIKLQESALTAFATLGCRGYARVDYRVSPQEQIFCLEVNTVPGMTEVSLVPMAAAAAGIGFGDLVERIVRSALT